MNNYASMKIPPAPCGDTFLVGSIQEALQCPRWVGELLLQRGICDVTSAVDYMQGPSNAVGDPWLLKGMDDAVETLLRFRSSGKELCVFGDYDLDGISGAALLVLALRRAGGWRVNYRLPSRFGGGYGLSMGQVQEIAAQGMRGLVTVDTGVTATAEIAEAKRLGLEVVVVDHHRPPDDGMPNADAILDPWQDGCTYPHRDLSAVGVAWKLVCALYHRIDLGGADDFMDLVTLGTLSDMMPMNAENRQVLRMALSRMHQSVFPGVKVLCEDVVDANGYLGSQDVLFRIAPLMNAPGRLSSPDLALEMLLSTTEKDARRMLELLREANDKRRVVEQEVTAQAMLQAQERVKNSRVLVVDSIGWHLGVLGIVASKLTQAFGRPAAVVSIGPDGLGSASVRGVPGFNWHQALSDAREHFVRWGGHQNAAGFSVKAGALEAARASFERSAEQQEYVPGEAEPVVECHAEVRLLEMNQGCMEWLRKLEPFGRENPMPVFVARQVRLPTGIREVRGGHLQFEVSQEEGVKFAAVAFGFGPAKPWLQEHASALDLAFVPTWNSYRGRRVLQLQIKFFAASRPAGSYI